MRKFTKVEGRPKVLSQAAHKKVAGTLRRLGKAFQELTDEERENLNRKLDNDK